MPSGFIWVRRVAKDDAGVVTKASRPLITGNCGSQCHFCNDCHSKPGQFVDFSGWKTKKDAPMKACTGPGKCPLGGTHKPNGEESPLGCAMCRAEAALGAIKNDDDDDDDSDGDDGSDGSDDDGSASDDNKEKKKKGKAKSAPQSKRPRRSSRVKAKAEAAPVAAAEPLGFLKKLFK
jgi:hypothetical protein